MPSPSESREARGVRRGAASRRVLLFLGVFSVLIVALSVATSLLVQTNVLRVQAHVTIGLAGLGPLVAYLVLSLRFIQRTKD